ncbi:hypothetical protein Tco_0946254 [Tanacetum coccineum]
MLPIGCGSWEDDDRTLRMNLEDEKEEEHTAPTDSTAIALPAVDHAPSAEETEPFETDESAATPPPHPAYRVTSRILNRDEPPTPVLTYPTIRDTTTLTPNPLTFYITILLLPSAYHEELQARVCLPPGRVIQSCIVADPGIQRRRLKSSAADRRRQTQFIEALKLLKRLQTQMTEFERQRGPAKGLAQPDAPEEAGSSS